MKSYDSSHVNTMLTKLKTLINKKDLKDMYKIWFCYGWELTIDATLEEYNQMVTFGIWHQRLYWYHEFPYPSNPSIKLDRNDKFAEKMDIFSIPDAEARNLCNRLSALKGEPIKPVSNTVLNKQLMNLSKQYYALPYNQYGERLLDILNEHTK